MLPALTTVCGNPSSHTHAFGWRAGALIDAARERVAGLIGAHPSEILFTSGATESDNLAVKGIARALALKGRHIVTCATEHPAVLESCRRLRGEGFSVTVLPVGADGRLCLAELEAALRDDTILVSVMMANNETGVLHPVREIGALCKEKGIYFHCDAVQALGWEKVDVQELGIDLLSISAHKMHGPKGVGALYLRRRNPRVRLEPLFDGGGQERGLRPGTLNVPGIAGLGAAAEIVMERRETDAAHVRSLRDRLLDALRSGLGGVEVNGSLRHRLPNNLNVSLAGVDAATLLGSLMDLAISSGAACASAEAEASHVLTAMGLEAGRIHTALRFGLHRFTTEAEIDAAAEMGVGAAQRLRAAAEHQLEAG
jgi:cysteine desulfurase